MTAKVALTEGEEARFARVDDVNSEMDESGFDAIRDCSCLADLNLSLIVGIYVRHIGDSWFITWHEAHPEVGKFEDHFGNSATEWTDESFQQWREMSKGMPRQRAYAKQISQREAYELLARYWLPQELYGEAGVA